MISNRALKLYTFLGVFGIVLLVFLPSVGNEFIDWDDLAFVTQNGNIQSISFESIKWMLTTFYAKIWLPLTWFSHALDISIFGLNPSPHRLINILFHCFNTVFFGLLIIKLTSIYQERHLDTIVDNTGLVLCAAGAALLFGVHPLRVESVVWISERKDVMCAFFYLLSLLQYLRFARDGKSSGYYFAIVFALLAMLSKPMAVTLPLVLLLLDYFPLKRLNPASSTITNNLKEKGPFFLLSAITLAMNTAANWGQTVPFDYVTPGMRFMNAFYSIAMYIKQSLIPGTLIPIHQMDRSINYFGPTYIISLVIIVLITIAAFGYAFRGRRLWLTCWLYFLVTLAPASGLLMSYRHSMADRYTYLPTLSLWFLVGLGAMKLWSKYARSSAKSAVHAAILLVIVAVATFYADKTRKQAEVWKNSETFWVYIYENADYIPDSAYFAIGKILEKKGKSDEAFKFYTAAESLNPRNPTFKWRFAVALLRKGDTEAAQAKLSELNKMGINRAEVNYYVGRSLYNLKDYQEAIHYLRKAVQADPKLNSARAVLIGALIKSGDTDAAKRELVEAKTKGLKLPPAIEQALLTSANPTDSASDFVDGDN